MVRGERGREEEERGIGGEEERRGRREERRGEERERRDKEGRIDSRYGMHKVAAAAEVVLYSSSR